MKRITIFVLCLLMALALAACKKPFGQTPYQSVDPADPPTFTEEDTDSNDESGDTTDSSDEQSTPDGGDSQSSTTTGGQNHTPDDGDQDEDRDDDDGDGVNNSQPAGSTTTGSGKTTTRNGRTTTKTQTGKSTTRRTGTTTRNQGGDDDDDNTADLDWGDETTKKPGTTSSTTKKPTTTTTKKPTTTIKPGTQVLPKAGDSVHEYLELAKVTVDLKSGTGSMVVRNISRGFETEQTNSRLVYTCYDKKGKSLGNVQINIGRIHAEEDSGEIIFTLPSNTYSMVFKESIVEFWTDGFH